MKYSEQNNKRYCNSKCRNDFYRKVSKRRHYLKDRIDATKAKLAKLEFEYAQFEPAWKVNARHKYRLYQRVRYASKKETINKRLRDKYYEDKLLKVRRDYEQAKLLPLDMSKVWSSYGL